MIGTSSFIGFAVMIAGGFILPLAAAVWWIITKKEKVTTVLVGAATWFVFALLLETVPKLLFFTPATSVGKAVLASPVLYTVFGALMAGVFEETGRFVAFKTVLKNRVNRETSISHGIGHGGFEAMFLAGYTGVQYMIYAIMINAGQFQPLIDAAAAQGADVSSLEALPESLMAVTPLTGCLSILERIFAMLLHVGLSILVFYAVKKSKIRLYILAVVLHALFDVPAALYQVGCLNLYAVEAILAVYSVIFFALAYLTLYRKDKPEEAASPAPLCEPGTTNTP